MKSILADFRRSKTTISTILEALNFNIGELHPWKCQKYPKIQNLVILKCIKYQFFAFKLTKTWFHVKSEWQKNCEISTLCPDTHLQFHVLRAKSLKIRTSTQCEYLAIFMQLWFSHFKMSKIPKSSKFRAAEMVELPVFGGFKLTKIAFT